MRIKINKCTQCLCNSCSRFHCPHPNQRCSVCYRLGLRACYDCDWWESAKTAPKRLKVSRKGKSAQDALNMKLDYIIDQLGLVPPYVERSHHTHDVMFEDCTLVRCDCYSSAVDYVKRMQSQFSKPLRIVRVDIEL